MIMKKIKVVELFSGVGGFRLGLEGWKGLSSSSNYKNKLNSNYHVIWSNQFEPSTKNIQHANIIYKKRWPNSNHSEEDIEKVIQNDFKSIPDHDLLVAGFPCQDYSVAGQVNKSKGLYGKKGVLWWSIYTILKRKLKKPHYIILENVPRILSTPKGKGGRDFYTILSCLSSLGYIVEWRVINASDYGFPQKRRRIYLMGYHKNSIIYSKLIKKKPKDIIMENGILSKSFSHIKNSPMNYFAIDKINKINSVYDFKETPFKNSGVLIDGIVYTMVTKSIKNSNGMKIKDILQKSTEIDKSHLIDFSKKLSKEIIKKMRSGKVLKIKNHGDYWKYQKGKKNEIKINKTNGYEYNYDEGKMNLFEDLNSPSRTLVTKEITKSPNRLTHLIKQGEVIRNFTPIEIERLNMFPDNHTKDVLITDFKRSFLMGNALVVGIIEKIGIKLAKETN